MSTIRLAGFGAALVLSALIGGTIIGSVAAQTMPPASSKAPTAPQAPAGGSGATPAAVDAAPAGKYCDAYRKAYAAALGVDASALAPAAARAAESTIAAAVAAGDLTPAKADRLIARLKESPLGGCPRLADRLGGARPLTGVLKEGVAAVADVLGLTPAELRARLKDGKDLKQIAAAKGVPYATVTAAALAPVKARLDAAVAAGTIKQARADRILARLQQNLADGRLRNERPAPAATQGG